MRLIDALLAEYDRVHVGPPGGARKLIEDASTIEPKREQGKWIETDEGTYCGVCFNIHMMITNTILQDGEARSVLTAVQI